MEKHSNELSNIKNKAIRSQFIYGNYNKYYGYRNEGKQVHDTRLTIFENHGQLFVGKDVLDVGCNNGFITFGVAQKFQIKSIIGIDIDPSLIKVAKKTLLRYKKFSNSEKKNNMYPYNVHFVCANYILRHDNLLEIEEERFDIVLCLSVTKWIHLNFGDSGIKQTFQRIYSQLRSGGKLILEAQQYESYKRRKKMTDIIYDNYKSIQFFPQQFTEYLLSTEVGFSKAEIIAVPEACAGFKRPVQIFHKL